MMNLKVKQLNLETGKKTVGKIRHIIVPKQ